MEYLQNLQNSLSTQFGNVLPGVLGAVLVLIIGFIVAKVVKSIVRKVMNKTSIDEKIGEKMKTSFRVDEFVAKLFYYLVLIYTLMISLNLLGVDGVLAPLEKMMQDFMGFLPNIVAAGVIGFAGYMIASIASEASGFLTAGIEKFGQKNGIDMGNISIAKIIKQLVFIFIFIPILIVALDTLKMEAISEPATQMLQEFMLAVPRIIAAALLIGVFYIAGKYLIAMAVGLLKSFGLDNMSSSFGLDKVIGSSSLSQIIGNIAMFFIMFTAVIAAVDKLELLQIGDILNDILEIAGSVFFGMIILGGGVFISNIAAKAMSANKDNQWLGSVVKFAIMGLFLAFALHTMGIAENIVELAFGLTLGAIAVAFALAFGLGGRDSAGKHLDHLLKKLRKED